MSNYLPSDAPRLGPLGYRLPKSLRSFSLIVMAMLAIDLIAQIPLFLAASNRINVANDLINGGSIDLNAASSADDGVGAAALIVSLLFLATAVVFIMWSFRLVSNVRSFGVEPKPGPGWAIGGWFIPFANFVIPARTLFRADQHSDGAGPSRRWVIVLWAIGLFAGNAALRSPSLVRDDVSDPDYLSSIIDGDQGIRGGAVVLAITAVLGMIMVRNLTQRQEKALEQYTVLYGPGGVYANRQAAPIVELYAHPTQLPADRERPPAPSYGPPGAELPEGPSAAPTSPA